MKRMLAAAFLLAGIGAGSYAPAAAAGTECRGLQSCILVVGPWVQVPAGSEPTYFNLACPGRGQTVGGLDADRARSAVDLTFLGELGGPVAPGTTTGREIVFVARATGGRAVTFRPRLGCIPAAGGGGRSRTSYRPTRTLSAHVAVPKAVAPKLVRRARVVRLRALERQTASFACRPKERLLAASVAIAFRTKTAPDAARLASIRASVTRSGRVATATVRGAPLAGVRVELQILVVCAR
ncbi:MAG TPA: hypothetical protein VNI55_11130 [Gaiellaceae bacterium]|nr:hypothetical protein [Gaiellaceae bacterium]